MATNNRSASNGAKQELDRYKMEASSEVGVDLTKSNLTAKEAGSVGGRMVKNMINKAKSSQ